MQQVRHGQGSRYALSRLWRSELTTYEESNLNLAGLRKFAKRVATETKVRPEPEIGRPTTETVTVPEMRRKGFLGRRTEVVQVTKSVQGTELVIGDHWVLHKTLHNIESHDRGKFTEYYEQRYWALQGDGALVMIWAWDEFTKWQSGGRGSRKNSQPNLSIRSKSSDSTLPTAITSVVNMAVAPRFGVTASLVGEFTTPKASACQRR